MSPFERWTLRLGALLGGATGIGLGVVRYLGGREGEFGPEPSPLLPAWQHAHVLAVPVLVLAIGAAVAGHAKSVLEGRFALGRRSGLALGVLALPLVLGGPLVQVVTDGAVRSWVGWIHAGVGALFALAFAVHWSKRVGLKALAQRAEASPRPTPTTGAHSL